MKTQYIYNEDGYLVRIYEGRVNHANSTTEPPPNVPGRRPRFVNGAWLDYPEVTPVEFMLLFTSQERVAIKEARKTDPALDDFFQLLEDPRLRSVRLGQPSVQEGLAYLVSLNMITESRRSQILAAETN